MIKSKNIVIVKKYSRFADFRQVKEYCRFATLGKSLRLPNKTPLGETGCLSKPYFLLFTFCLGIQFFDSLHFPNTVSWATFGYLSLTVQHL